MIEEVKREEGGGVSIWGRGGWYRIAWCNKFKIGKVETQNEGSSR